MRSGDRSHYTWRRRPCRLARPGELRPHANLYPVTSWSLTSRPGPRLRPNKSCGKRKILQARAFSGAAELSVWRKYVLCSPILYIQTSDRPPLAAVMLCIPSNFRSTSAQTLSDNHYINRVQQDFEKTIRQTRDMLSSNTLMRGKRPHGKFLVACCPPHCRPVSPAIILRT